MLSPPGFTLLVTVDGRPSPRAHCWLQNSRDGAAVLLSGQGSQLCVSSGRQRALHATSLLAALHTRDRDLVCLSCHASSRKASWSPRLEESLHPPPAHPRRSPASVGSISCPDLARSCPRSRLSPGWPEPSWGHLVKLPQPVLFSAWEPSEEAEQASPVLLVEPRLTVTLR